MVGRFLRSLNPLVSKEKKKCLGASVPDNFTTTPLKPFPMEKTNFR